MCGIVGFTSGWEKGECAQVLGAMTEALRHRGPDGAGQYLTRSERSGKTIALGHQRLSIIDLLGGNQPLHLDGGR